jgi:hypothetical protein
MIASLCVAAWALRAGLALRRARHSGAPRGGALRRAHIRFAKPAVVLLGIGFVAGPVSAVWLRGMDPFASFHSLAGGIAALLFGATAILGRRLERGRSRAADTHGWLGLLSLLFAALTAVAGLALLP